MFKNKYEFRVGPKLFRDQSQAIRESQRTGHMVKRIQIANDVAPSVSNAELQQAVRPQDVLKKKPVKAPNVKAKKGESLAKTGSKKGKK